MLSSPWGTCLPFVLGTLHQSDVACNCVLAICYPTPTSLSSIPDTNAPRSPTSPGPTARPQHRPVSHPSFSLWLCLASTTSRLPRKALCRTLHRVRLRHAPNRINPQHHS